MCDFHYNTIIKNAKRNNVNLCFTDTDSLCYNLILLKIIKNILIYQITQKNIHYIVEIIKKLLINLKMKHQKNKLLNL